MASAGDDFASRKAQSRGCLAHQVHAGGIEWLGRDFEQLGQFQPHPAIARQETGLARELGLQTVELGIVGVAELDGEAHLAGDHVAAVGGDQQLADGAAAVLAAGAHHPVHQVDDAGGADQRVLAGGWRRGAGMAVLSGDHRVVPNLRLGAGDDADFFSVALQDRSLLDMQFEIGVGGEGFCGFRPAVADRVQGCLHADALGIGQRIGFFAGKNTGPDAGAHQRMAEAAAFLVGPVDQFDRRFGDDAEIVQAAHYLQPGEDAECAVEFAAAGLAVQMAAEQHRQAGGIAAWASGEHVADLIDPHGQAGGFALGAEFPPAAAVRVGKRQAPDAALRGRANFGEPHQAVP